MKTKRIFLPAVIFHLALTTVTSCDSVFGNELLFWVYGSESELSTFTKMTNQFNQTYGKEHDITVKISSYPADGSYTSVIKASATTTSGPDVFLLVDDTFKTYVHLGIAGEIQEEFNAVTDIDLGDMFPSISSRFRYDIEKNTQNADDPLYGLPVNTKPTALYYNETYLKGLGVTVISVDEKDLDAFNAGTLKDKRGYFKSEYVDIKDITIPKKGFYRSEHPYIGYGEYVIPTETEKLVFNNRIPMNWDESEDLARLCTPSYNPKIKTVSNNICEYGYFTEWWFNYGWSVGGNCLTDISGAHDWNFSLLDGTPNYIVAPNKEFTGHTGRIYQAQETLEFRDRLNIRDNELVKAADDGRYLYGNEEAGIRPEVIDAVDMGILIELPSIKEAFLRYLKLGAAKTAEFEGEYGLDIAPNPNKFANKSYADYFYSGNIAICANYSVYMNDVARQMTYKGWEWDVAPLVQYKEYNNAFDPDDDTVRVRGKDAGMSNTTSMVVRKASKKKDKAAAFVKWMASPLGQSIRVKDGWFPNQQSLVSQIEFTSQNAAKNYEVFSEALAFEECGDWMYLPNYEWVDVWAVPLNSKVRNGTQTYVDWKRTAIRETNEILKKYN